MNKDTVTILHFEYPMFRNDDSDHIFATALSIMYEDFSQNEKFQTISSQEQCKIIQLFSDIHQSLVKQKNTYEERMGSASLIELDRIQQTYPLFEMLFYETEYQVKISIAPLKCLSISEHKSLDMIEHFQRFNKTTQQKREEQIDKIID